MTDLDVSILADIGAEDRFAVANILFATVIEVLADETSRRVESRPLCSWRTRKLRHNWPVDIVEKNSGRCRVVCLLSDAPAWSRARHPGRDVGSARLKLPCGKSA